MKIQIATAPCSWGVFFPDGRMSGVPYETFLSQAAEAGYQRIELGPDGYLPQQAEVLLEKLGQHHLSVCAGTATIAFGLTGQAQCRDAVDALAKRLTALHCTDMVVMDDSARSPEMGPKGQWTTEQWNRIYENIRFTSKYLKEAYGVRMVFHPHAGTAIEYTGEIQRLLSLDEIYLCFDTGHHALSNGGLEDGERCVLDFIRQNRQRIVYLHFKNVDAAVRRRAEEEGWGVLQMMMKQVMCDLEDGVIRFPLLRDLLEETGYQGTAVIEQDMFQATAGEAFQTARKNLQYLRRIRMI